MKNIKTFESFLNEGTLDQGEIAIYIGGEGTTHIFKQGKGYYGYNDEFDFVAKDKKELEKKLKSWRYELLAGSIDEASVTPKEVGRDTGVKLNIKSIKKYLERKGYKVEYAKGSSMINPKMIDARNLDSGNSITVSHNGELFGDENWHMEVASEKEFMKALDQYEKELSESEVNEGSYKHMPELIELLSDIDAMEMDPEEFIDQMVKYYELDADTAADLFDAYWSLGAKKRFHFEEKDWEKFIKKQGIN